MGWGLRILLALILLLVLAGIGLVIYGSSLTPEPQPVEQVLPDDRFPS